MRAKGIRYGRRQSVRRARLTEPKRLPFLLARVHKTDGQRAYVCSGCHRRSRCVGPAGARRACRRLDGLSDRGGVSIGDPSTDASALPADSGLLSAVPTARVAARRSVRLGRRRPGEPVGGSARHGKHSAGLVYRASCRRRHWSGLVRPLFGEAAASRSQTNSLIPIARSARRS